MQPAADQFVSTGETAGGHREATAAVDERCPATAAFPREPELPDLATFIGPGQIVLHLGCRVSQTCSAAGHLIGPRGRVIGVVSDDATLSELRKSPIGGPCGDLNIEFRKGRPQDLQLDLHQFDAWLEAHPAHTSDAWLQAATQADRLRQETPLIVTDSIDVVIGLRAFHLVPLAERSLVIAEIYRVLKRGGRVVFDDIVSDEEVPAELQNDSWQQLGLSSAYREDTLLEVFEAAGFHGIEIVARQRGPLASIAGIEFRQVTIQAFKGKAGPCFERHQAVIYNGPWKAVIDDDGHTLYRGKRMAVCDKTFQIYSQAPYAPAITPVPPVTEIPLAQARPFNCRVNAVRDPRETKETGAAGFSLLEIKSDCGPSGCC